MAIIVPGVIKRGKTTYNLVGAACVTVKEALKEARKIRRTHPNVLVVRRKNKHCRASVFVDFSRIR